MENTRDISLPYLTLNTVVKKVESNLGLMPPMPSEEDIVYMITSLSRGQRVIVRIKALFGVC